MIHSAIRRAIAPALALMLCGAVARAEEKQYTIESVLYRVQASLSGDTSLTEDIGLKSAVVYPTVAIVAPTPIPIPENEDPNAPGLTLEERIKRREALLKKKTEVPPQPTPLPPRMPGEDQTRYSFFTLADLKIGKQDFHLDEKGVLWNGGPFPSENRDVVRLGMPKVVVIEGIEAEVSCMDGTDLQYLEQAGDGLYRLVTSSLKIGLKWTVKVADVIDGRIHLKPLHLTLDTVQGREPIEGVHLDVGKPIVSGDELDCDLRLTPNRPYGVMVNSPRGTLLLTLAVSEEGDSADKLLNPTGPSDGQVK